MLFVNRYCTYMLKVMWQNGYNKTMSQLVKVFRAGTHGVLYHMCFALQKHTCLKHIVCAL